jgi:hypothetical protein
MTTTINMEIDETTANIFTAAPAEDRNRLSVLWGVLIREYQAAPSFLGKLMDEIGNKAEDRGLTAATLKTINIWNSPSKPEQPVS